MSGYRCGLVVVAEARTEPKMFTALNVHRAPDMKQTRRTVAHIERP